MDGDRGELQHSVTGEKAERDIVQTIVFRKWRHDFKGFARELLGEIAGQIKGYFSSRNIYPNANRTKMEGGSLGKQWLDVKI